MTVDLRHGTRYAYDAKRCRCDPCRSMKSRRMAALRARAREAEVRREVTGDAADPTDEAQVGLVANAIWDSDRLEGTRGDGAAWASYCDRARAALRALSSAGFAGGSPGHRRAAVSVEHVWAFPLRTRGPRKGQPGDQEQCLVCGVWRTELSERTFCPEVWDGDPFALPAEGGALDELPDYAWGPRVAAW